MYELAADNPPLEAQVNIHDTKGQTVVGSGHTNETHIRPGEARKWNKSDSAWRNAFRLLHVRPWVQA